MTSSGYNYFLFHKRSSGKSLLGFRISQQFQDDVAAALDEANISYVKKPKSFIITVDRNMLEANAHVIRSVSEFTKKSRE